jgi:hypothetical protein
VGALVDEGIYTDFLESLPPISWKGNYFQNSEPYSHRLDEESGKWRATYSTFDGTDRKGVYRYLGTCFLNERIHRP